MNKPETESNNLFYRCFSYLIARNYPQGCEAFSEAYRNHPQEIRYLYGLLSALILRSGIKECLTALKTEKEITLHKDIVDRMLGFSSANPSLKETQPFQAIYNFGLFLNNLGHVQGAKIFLQAALLLEPAHAKTLAVLGELAIREENFVQGLRYYSQAAAGVLSHHS